MAAQKLVFHVALLLGSSHLVPGEVVEDSAAMCGAEGDCISQLQTRSDWGCHKSGCKPCKKLVPEVTKKCTTSNIMECIGEITNSGGVKTRLPDTCAESVTNGKPGVHVYQVTNDGQEVVTFRANEFCFDTGFDYAMSCFGAERGKCVEEGCMSCQDGETEDLAEKCVLKPGETKYMTVWYHEDPKCSRLAGKDLTKSCDISNLMECIGDISNQESVDTDFAATCALKAGLTYPFGAAVYKVTNDLSQPESLKGEDFCFKKEFNYAMSCFGDVKGHCQDQGCIGCDAGVVDPEGETCDFKAGETKYMVVWFEQPRK